MTSNPDPDRPAPQTQLTPHVANSPKYDAPIYDELVVKLGDPDPARDKATTRG